MHTHTRSYMDSYRHTHPCTFSPQARKWLCTLFYSCCILFKNRLVYSFSIHSHCCSPVHNRKKVDTNAHAACILVGGSWGAEQGWGKSGVYLSMRWDALLYTCMFGGVSGRRVKHMRLRDRPQASKVVETRALFPNILHLPGVRVGQGIFLSHGNAEQGL